MPHCSNKISVVVIVPSEGCRVVLSLHFNATRLDLANQASSFCVFLSTPASRKRSENLVLNKLDGQSKMAPTANHVSCDDNKFVCVCVCVA